MDRRAFLRAGLAGVAWSGVGRAWPPPPHRAVTLVVDPSDDVASGEPARRALAALRRRLEVAGHDVGEADAPERAPSGLLCVVACGARSRLARAASVGAAGGAGPADLPDVPDSLLVRAAPVHGRPVVLACGADARGLAYALRDLADRVRAEGPFAPSSADGSVERPANAVRSVMRQFTSEALDTGWLHDRDAWRDYLGMLAGHRFNRLHLAFGLGYDSLLGVRDDDLLFVYPFLVSVPGYDVRAQGLSDAERNRNLDTLRFVAAEAVATGLDFQLGIWTHGYRLPDSPAARRPVVGLTAGTHAAYCRDGLTLLLRSCPAITSVALRIHGESGVAEGSYDFWSTVMDGVTRSGRMVEIDLHAKGIDETMIGRALATGMPVCVSPKYAAEHLGMPYHQASIRDLEMPVEGRVGEGLMTLSEGARSFTRYGYADLLRDDRRYQVRPRVFSGTQRLLAWGDPMWAAAASRSFGFCGMEGADLMEPLTCRGRRGTGSGNRDGYLHDPWPPDHDWAKYEPWYRAWGRTAFAPAAGADVFDRAFGDGASARALQAALASASRVLPLVTMAYLPSAACDAYWPEIYWNQPIVAPAARDPYFDTPRPATFQHASPLDPQLFSSMADFAAEVLAGSAGARVSPAEVAGRLEGFAADAEAGLAGAGTPEDPVARCTALDVRMLVGLARFFAAKLRSGVLYALYETTADGRALREAVVLYAAARDAWSAVVALADGVYQDDLSASDRFSERGQWADRLAGIDEDLERMRTLAAATGTGAADPRIARAIGVATSAPERPRIACAHAPPEGFTPGVALPLEITVQAPAGASVRLQYRHVDQSERWASVEMTARDGVHRAEIAAAYTRSTFPVQYYFEIRDGAGRAALHPGFGPAWADQPYAVVRPS
jgi:hypothetical protein